MSSRRRFLRSLPVAAIGLRTLAATAASPSKYVLIGTSTSGSSQGVYRAEWTPSTGELGPLTLAAELKNPTFLALGKAGPARRHLYTVSEISRGVGSVASLSLSPDAQLKLLGNESAEGSGTTHLSVHPDGRSVFAANYGGGSVTSFRITADGTTSPAVSHFQYTGSGPNPKRQEKPHAHSATPDPSGRYLLVNDLGLDRINVYRINASTAELTPNDPPYWSSRPGAGPRHIGFSPNGRRAYCVNELDSTVDLLDWDGTKGTLTTRQTVETLPPEFPVADARGCEIAITHDGRFAYVANRGHESIACFSINRTNGELTFMERVSNGGKSTRYITLDATNRWLLLANEDSANVVILERNTSTGKLSAPRHTYTLDKPMCIVFA